MKSKYPDSIEEAQIDLEIDFEVRGGLQRFKTIAELRTWIAEEREFWKWLEQRRQQLGPVWEQFWRFESQTQNEITGQAQRWNQFVNERIEVQARIDQGTLNDQELESAKARVVDINSELGRILDNIRQRIRSHIHTDVVQSRVHLLRTEPEAQFAGQIAESDPEAATHALSYFLARFQNQQGEFKGRMLAALYAENITRKIQPDQAAFKKAIVTWSKELADFKARYEAQESEFDGISSKHLEAEESWRKRHDQLAEDFSTMRLAAEKDLKNLKDTYETHMQLHGPLTYWRGKRKEHRDQIAILRKWGIRSGIVGFIVLLITAWLVLPENHPSGTIPWRQIGYFVLTSTFVLWIVKLLVKLLLSHIHLYADAKEREVMISTFMALIRRPESAQNLKREDIAIVLAPIFKPSTTGVIKDDGGPTSLGDFIGRLSGK